MATRLAATGPVIRAFALILRGLSRHPGPAAALLALIWLGHPLLSGRVWVGGALVLLLMAIWAWLSPATLRGCFNQLRCLARGCWIRRHWSELMTSCGLAEHIRSRPGRLEAPAQVPRLRSARARWPRVRLVVRPLMGQTLADFEVAAERLRVAVAATDVRVQARGVNEVAITFTVGDGLSRATTYTRPPALPPGLERVRMGRLEDDEPWYLPLGPHTLVAGCSGSGKGSLFWSFAIGLAPAVRDGRIRLHGIDLKGGMEILMGDRFFTTHATTAADAVVVLERLVAWMHDRTRRYAGRVRSHVVSVEEPLHVLMIDELAALTAYCQDRELQRRAERAINLLCSQGRAPGFVVFACLQDPRKEVIPSRGLFTQMIGLRLKDMSETAMVLGELALTSGASCHRISCTTPGMGYVVPEDGGAPVRVRAAFVPDETIQDLAIEFATPTRIPVVVPQAENDDVATMRSRTRNGGRP